MEQEILIGFFLVEWREEREGGCTQIGLIKNEALKHTIVSLGSGKFDELKDEECL